MGRTPPGGVLSIIWVSVCAAHMGGFYSVLSSMRPDEISFVAKRDDLIILFGSSWFEKSGPSRVSYISDKMALKFSKHGYYFNKTPIKVDGKLTKTRKFIFLSVRTVKIASKRFVVQFQAIIKPGKS